MSLPKEFRCPHCGAFITATHNGAVKDVKANVPVPRTVSGRFLDPKADPLELVQAWEFNGRYFRTRAEAEASVAPKPEERERRDLA